MVRKVDAYTLLPPLTSSCAGVVDGVTVHLVKGSAPAQSPAPSPAVDQAPSTNANNQWESLMGGGMGGMGMGSMQNMQQQMMQNPEMMQQMMNSPMMQVS
jgi:ubiquilin